MQLSSTFVLVGDAGCTSSCNLLAPDTTCCMIALHMNISMVPVALLACLIFLFHMQCDTCS
jgi:hypothetical protein